MKILEKNDYQQCEYPTDNKIELTQDLRSSNFVIGVGFKVNRKEFLNFALNFAKKLNN